MLWHRDGIYSTDSLSKDGDRNVLTWMVCAIPLVVERDLIKAQGTMLEEFLTKPRTEFQKLLRASPLPEPNTDAQPSAYRYAKVRVIGTPLHVLSYKCSRLATT